VSFYVPLAERPTADVAALRAGATRRYALHAIAEKEHRPVLLGELGYPSHECRGDAVGRAGGRTRSGISARVLRGGD
jgi:hypothetical protein